MSGRLVVGGIIGAALLLSVHGANAQMVGQQPSLSAATVSAFMNDPGQLLTRFPGAGPEMVKQVRDLVQSDKATLPAVIGLLKLASPEQQIAIADALAQVAKAYAKNDPSFANQIQQSVANAGIPEVAKAYAEAAGDTGTAATGGGGGGAGGGQVGALPTGGQNNAVFPNSTGVPTQASSLTGGTFGGGSTLVTNTTNTVQVSPF